MDILNTLLLYFSLLTATGLEAAPTPELMPVFTPAPTAIVEQASPGETAGSGVVGAITLTPPPATAAPEPTVTPNAAYGYLRQGQRGDAVRRLQTRLRELGYLTGNIDGSYGRQTYNAVLAFQHANGLTADGVAGPATQTVLFEDPKVKPNLARVTVSPAPTATPDASGRIPLPADPTAIWVDMRAQTVLVNGQPAVRADGSAPRMWLRGSERLISLSDLAEAVPDWSLEGADGSRVVFSAAGYTVTVWMTDEAAADYKAGGYCESYLTDVNGEGCVTRQGDVVFDGGRWAVTDTWLSLALRAGVVWDIDEMTLVIQVRDRAMAESAD